MESILKVKVIRRNPAHAFYCVLKYIYMTITGTKIIFSHNDILKYICEILFVVAVFIYIKKQKLTQYIF